MKRENDQDQRESTDTDSRAGYETPTLTPLGTADDAMATPGLISGL